MGEEEGSGNSPTTRKHTRAINKPRKHSMGVIGSSRSRLKPVKTALARIRPLRATFSKTAAKHQEKSGGPD